MHEELEEEKSVPGRRGVKRKVPQVAPPLESMLLDQWDPRMDEEYVIQTTDDSRVVGGEHLKTYKQRRVESPFLNFGKVKGLDVMCLPQVFPNGKGGWDDDRKRKVRAREYCMYRLAHKSGRFRRCAKWCQMMHFLKLENSMNQGLYASTHTGCKVSKMKVGELRQRVSKGDVDVERDISVAFAKIRGTKEYWQQQQSDLRAMDEQFGPATFFVTLSCAEWKWPELERYLRTVNSVLPGVQSMNASDLIKVDPVSVSEFFERRFQAFMKWVLCPRNEKGEPEEGVLGVVEHYYWRREYQARGAPHIHMKLWIKDAPVLGRSTNEEVLEFIAKYIRADGVNVAKNPELASWWEVFRSMAAQPRA